MVRVEAIHPVLSVRDVRATANWFSQFGFGPLFADNDDAPTYAGIGRDGVEVHLQWHSDGEWKDGLDGAAYRFLVDDPDALFAEVSARSQVLDGREVRDTGWGTREFGVYDPDGNALFFYRNLQ